MRAIENGRYLVRAANTGISGIVDPYGRVLAADGIFEPAVLVGEARFLRTSTFYTRIGDVVRLRVGRRDRAAAGWSRSVNRAGRRVTMRLRCRPSTS